MNWMPLLAFGFVVAGLALCIRGLTIQKSMQQAGAYRRRYQQVVARIDRTVHKVNTLANLLTHVKNPIILDDFESCLRLLETLLQTLNRIPNVGFRPNVVAEILPVHFRVEKKIDETFRKFKKSIEERPFFESLLNLWREETVLPGAGCYFCSRPYIKTYFTMAVLKIDGIHLKVLGCKICVTELKRKKRVKVLYFLERGRPVHWSLVDNYKPAEQFWDLNKRRPKYREPAIELVELNE